MQSGEGGVVRGKRKKKGVQGKKDGLTGEIYTTILPHQCNLPLVLTSRHHLLHQHIRHQWERTQKAKYLSCLQTLDIVKWAEKMTFQECSFKKIHCGLLWAMNWMQCEDRTGTQRTRFVYMKASHYMHACDLREINVWFTMAAGIITQSERGTAAWGAFCETELKRRSSVVGFVSDQEAWKRKGVVMLKWKYLE